ncbi:MAG: glycosyltransferase family 4 protein [Chloroflexi bacterium]|nr:glycosyltransferase family 4 protein [Chloroflexota bacterium]
MRIGIDARITYYSRGGIRNYVVHLLDALAAVDRESRYFVLHSRKDPTPPHPSPTFRSVACWTPAHYRLDRLTFGLEAARLGLDLLHSPDFIPPAFGYRHSIITVHDLNFLYYPEFLTAESYRYYVQQIGWAVNRASHILVDSHATKADVVAHLDVLESKITVAHLAADRAYRPQPPDVCCAVAAKYGLDPGYLIFVGTLEPRKNLPGLLTAYRQLLDEKVTAVPLVIVGTKGWLYDDVFQKVQALRLASHVHFLHQVPDADLPALYSAATLLVSPSFYEGFGLPALEAMSCGTPVIVADRASLPEIVGDAGLLADPDDPFTITRQMSRVLEDPALQARLSERGLRQAARFTWARTAQVTLSAYRRVLDEG